jgi:mono/diheme cytochrome c family protein
MRSVGFQRTPIRSSIAAALLVIAVVCVGASGPQGAPAGPPQGGRGAGAQTPTGPAPGRGGAGALGAGSIDTPAVDAAAADRGRTTYAAECVSCHGATARGTDTGPNLVRSVVVLRDRFGSEVGPFLKKGHQTQSGKASTSFSDPQITDLAHFLRQRVNDMLRGSPIFKPGNVLTGDAKAGATFFSGGGKCASCHTATANNLAGIGGRYEPIDIQQRMLFPNSGRGGRGRGGAPPASAVTVSVSTGSGAPVNGVLVQMDDFIVMLRDSGGVIRTFRRTPSLKIEKNEPLAAHYALLDTITDKQIHDLVAYLESLR